MAPARRRFLKAAATLPLAPKALAGAQTAGPDPSAGGGGAEAVAEALAEAVRREHPGQLDAGALAEVRKQIARSLERAGRLREAARLTNADPPVSTFTPVTAPERGRP